MPLTDYKWWFVRRNDDGFITECGVRFYEGEITTEPEANLKGEVTQVTRYRRKKRLEAKDLKHFKSFKKEVNGNDAVMFTPDDFGEIKTDEELSTFLNTQIKKDKNREVVEAQKI